MIRINDDYTTSLLPGAPDLVTLGPRLRLAGKTSYEELITVFGEPDSSASVAHRGIRRLPLRPLGGHPDPGSNRNHKGTW